MFRAYLINKTQEAIKRFWLTAKSLDKVRVEKKVPRQVTKNSHRSNVGSFGGSPTESSLSHVESELAKKMTKTISEAVRQALRGPTKDSRTSGPAGRKSSTITSQLLVETETSQQDDTLSESTQDAVVQPVPVSIRKTAQVEVEITFVRRRKTPIGQMSGVWGVLPPKRKSPCLYSQAQLSTIRNQQETRLCSTLRSV